MTDDDPAVQVIIGELKRLVLDELKVFIEEDKLDAHAPLLDSGLGLDSITLFELITLIEKRYAITFLVQDLNSEIFASLAVVARQVHAMRTSNPAAEATP
jgi:acyl carrier protein